MVKATGLPWLSVMIGLLAVQPVVSLQGINVNMVLTVPIHSATSDWVTGGEQQGNSI